MIYKGKDYPVLTGPKGGKYIVVGNRKIYVKENSSKPTPKPEVKLKKYICYYEKRINGELIDDFKELCSAYSLDEARRHFEDEYRHNSNIYISTILEYGT